MGSISSSLSVSDKVLSGLGKSFLNFNSLVILIICLVAGVLVSFLAGRIIQRFSNIIGLRADRSKDIRTVTFLRRIETFLILSIALVRMIIIIISLYVWWITTHAGQQPSALIGASALALVLAYGLSGPFLRDIAFGSSMMAEQWFGVGDVVTVQPNSIHGVVEKITLRSTKLRSFSGETVWFSNQNINMVSVVRKGSWAIALEMFVNDPDKATELVEKTNYLLPKGPALLINPLMIHNISKQTDGIFQITIIGETAPGQDYIIREDAINVLNKLDSNNKEPIILSEIISRFTDQKSEIQFMRALKNAKKTKINPKIKIPKN